jgi:hypothetical protein
MSDPTGSVCPVGTWKKRPMPPPDRNGRAYPRRDVIKSIAQLLFTSFLFLLKVIDVWNNREKIIPPFTHNGLE